VRITPLSPLNADIRSVWPLAAGELGLAGVGLPKRVRDVVDDITVPLLLLVPVTT
jgi:hypothetical protein